MNDFLWVEKYRPQTVDECILPESVKQTFQSFIEQGEIPNLLLSGTAGVGKTTIAKALCNELGREPFNRLIVAIDKETKEIREHLYDIDSYVEDLQIWKNYLQIHNFLKSKK